MSFSAHSGAFGWADDQRSSAHCYSISQHHHASVPDHPSRSELQWTGGPRQESYVPTGLTSSTGSLSSGAFPPFSVYGGGVWQSDRGLVEAHLGPSISTPGDGANGPRTNLHTKAAAPTLEKSFPVMRSTFSAPQDCPPPPPDWTQAPRLPWQPSSSWVHPVCTIGRHSGYTSSISPLGTRPEISSFQLAASSVVPGSSDRRIVPTGHFLSMATPHSVQYPTRRVPVPVDPSTCRLRGERMDISLNATTFPCLWSSGETRCTALIAGDGRSVRGHLRSEHDFTCDGQTIVCAWGQCMASMQRRNIPRHIVACHFEIKVECPQCGMALSRADANRKHRRACAGLKMSTVMEVEEEDAGRLLL